MFLTIPEPYFPNNPDDNCPICYQEFIKDNPFYGPYTLSNMIQLPCSHWFHVDCIETWFSKDLSNICPLCRKSSNVKDDSDTNNEFDGILCKVACRGILIPSKMGKLVNLLKTNEECWPHGTWIGRRLFTAIHHKKLSHVKKLLKKRIKSLISKGYLKKTKKDLIKKRFYYYCI